MHSYYGKDNVPGGRSRRIAESESRGGPVCAYALLSTSRLNPAPDVHVERSVNTLPARLSRFAAVRLLPAAKRRQFAVRQFDSCTARRVASLPRESVGVLHIWNWLPRTVAALREHHPRAVVVRDVSIAREYDFEWGEDIRVENRLVDVFVTPSTYASDRLCSWGIPVEKIRQIPFGVDAERYNPRRTSEADPARPLRFAYAGAVSGRKGVPELLRVWRRIALPDAELHLYGTVKPEVEPWLEGLSRVHAHGFVELSQELPRNDVFVFPSHLEGSAKAVYEALACGLPVITTPNAGSIVRDGVEGYLVPPGDEDALAEVIQRLHTDSALRSRMGDAARTRAEEFPWSRYARAVWEMYEEATEIR